jgi:hypothetical protein
MACSEISAFGPVFAEFSQSIKSPILVGNIPPFSCSYTSSTINSFGLQHLWPGIHWLHLKHNLYSLFFF